MNGIIYPLIGVLVLLVNCAAIIMCFRPSRRSGLLFALGVGLILCVTIPLYQIWAYGPLAARILPRGLLFLPSLFLLQRGRVPQKLYFVASLLTITYILPIWAAFLARLLAGGDEGVFTWVMLGITVLLLCVYLLLAARHVHGLYERMFQGEGSGIWYLYALYPIASLYALSLLFDGIPPSFAWLSRTPLGVYFALTLFMLAGFLLLCTAIITSRGRALLDYELRLSKNILDTGRDYYELLAARQEALRILRHDYKHHLGVLEGLIRGGGERVAETYLAELKCQYDDGDSPVYSGNAVVDALLGSVAVRCAAQDTAFETAVSLPDGMTLQNHALCVVMGNLLENALEACAAMPQGQARQIRLDVKRKGEQLAVRVENTFDGLVLLDGGEVRSRKRDGGTGLRSVRLIAQRLGGSYHVQWDERMFYAYVLLNL